MRRISFDRLASAMTNAAQRNVLVVPGLRRAAIRAVPRSMPSCCARRAGTPIASFRTPDLRDEGFWSPICGPFDAVDLSLSPALRRLAHWLPRGRPKPCA
ncbi:MAG: hypothetical protein MZV49_15165 [Rhodopseudomonas palustris]|nr:hypothetical protein [Rhodopseudomonas palustris]